MSKPLFRRWGRSSFIILKGVRSAAHYVFSWILYCCTEGALQVHILMIDWSHHLKLNKQDREKMLNYLSPITLHVTFEYYLNWSKFKAQIMCDLGLASVQRSSPTIKANWISNWNLWDWSTKLVIVLKQNILYYILKLSNSKVISDRIGQEIVRRRHEVTVGYFDCRNREQVL